MSKMEYSFRDLSFGSKLISDLIEKQNGIETFTGEFFSLAKIPDQIAARQASPIDRDLLTAVLRSQNEDLNLTGETKNNIELLSQDSAFTITTGHQLNLLTGPLFSIYKIAQVVSIAAGLKQKFPQYNFVPLFWMATEDHDFEEINHIHLFNKKITWNKPGQNDVVAGRIQTNSLQTFFDEVESLFQNEELKQKIKLLASFYLDSDTLAQATRKLVNHLFGETGLVIIDGDDQLLKAKMIPVFCNEVSDQLVFKSVSQTNAALEKSGYHRQVHVRECNLFFIHEDGRRERIVFENGKFSLGGKDLASKELEGLIKSNPQNFSPNALMRPLYQELILPNLVYVGGGGEISYWLQLKEVFEKLKISFPMLRVRDSLFLLNPKQADELDKSGFGLNDLQTPAEILLKKMVVAKLGDSLQFKDADADLLAAKSKISEKVKRVDQSLVGMVEAEFAKMSAALEKIESKLMKAEKSKEEAAKNKIVKLQDKLFPHNHFQERHENFLNYFLSNPDFVKQVMETVQPADEPSIRILIV